MIHIQEKQDAHLPALRTIFLHERKRAFHWMDTSQYALEDFDKETEGEHILVALDDEIPVGFISLWLPDHFIHHLYISHTHTRKGIGRLLIEQTLTSIKKPVTLKCLIQNESAISFYIALGFREIGRGISGNDAFIHFKLG